MSSTKLAIGIVGLPNVGKSTLFQALTKKRVNIANYPFCTIDPNVGVVAVPDERLTKLAAMSQSIQTIPAIVEFYDIAGLVKGANKGEGLGNQFLSHIQDVSAVVMVLRCFDNPDIIHVENGVDPVRDLEIINAELILKDLDAVEKRLDKIRADAKSGKKEAARESEILIKIKERLSQNKLISDLAEESEVKNMRLLSAKKQIYLLNGQEKDISESLKEKIKLLGGDFIISDLSKNERSVEKLTGKAYQILNLISFFTTGEKETRAWTIIRGLKAPQAAGVIHTDFENKFIRADVVNWEKLLQSGSWLQAKNKGLIKTEGKEYVVEDGDVIVVKHS